MTKTDKPHWIVILLDGIIGTGISLANMFLAYFILTNIAESWDLIWFKAENFDFKTFWGVSIIISLFTTPYVVFVAMGIKKADDWMPLSFKYIAVTMALLIIWAFSYLYLLFF